ncbi:Polysaccharide pyruvyl transferase, partial [gut metagenome]
MQCYALQQILQKMGHEAIVLEREFNRQYTVKGACAYYSKLLIKKMLRRQASWHYHVAQERRDYIAKHTYRFIEQYIFPRSKHCYTTEQLKQEVARLQLDAVVVGSDQVWRPDYSPCQTNYFFDFLPEDSSVKRISYAASFGGDAWLFSPELTQQCGKLLQRFISVSVREQSAIQLCKKHFGVDAVQVLDPTMLLEPSDYQKIVGQRTQKRGSLFCYVLDRSNEKRELIQQIATRTSRKPFENMPELPDSIYNLYGDIDKCVYPPVEDWLSAFMEAEMVVTDSFHGTVFSILFNKPFWVVGNEGRGMARFESLLSMYGLQERMITASSVSKVDLHASIDWQRVNEKEKRVSKPCH